MKKLAIIKRKNQSDWKSCQNITENLLQSYKIALHDYEIKEFHPESEFNLFSSYSLAKVIKDWGAAIIIWIDHKPHPGLFIQGLNFAYQEYSFLDRPKCIIHIFGDFVLDCLGWQAIENEIHYQPVHFLTASLSQKKLIDLLINTSGVHSSVIPFPVNTEFFSLKNIDFINTAKNKWKINEKRIFLYTGRISYQKNIAELILLFQSIKNNDCELWIVGAWDNIHLPYTGKNSLTGSFYPQIQKILSQTESNNIRILGQLDSIELLEVYHAADFFVSLSTYNDEDFGMSPAEAICIGLPCLLSSWGGYNSFKKIHSNIKSLPIKFDDERPIINFNIAQKEILLHGLTPILSFAERQKNSELGIAELSVEKCANRIQSFNQFCEIQPINGFTKTFDTLCTKFRALPQSPFADRKGNISNFYKELYNCYAN